MSTNIGVGLNNNDDVFKAAREATISAMTRLNQKSNNVDLAIVFASIEFSNPKAIRGINSVINARNLIGSSGAGIISPFGIERRGIAIMLISSDEIQFISAIQKPLSQSNLFNAGQNLANECLEKAKASQRSMFIMFSDAKTANPTDILSGLKAIFGRSFPIFGSFATDNFCFKNSLVFYNNSIYADAAVGLLICSRILHFGKDSKHGWVPLGRMHEATSSSGNIINEIDNQPAFKVYEEYFDQAKKELQDNVLSHIAILYPLGIYLEAEKEYLLRNVLSLKADGSLFCQADVPQGSQIKLMMGTKDKCIAASTQAIWSAADQVRTKKIIFALIFNSLSRLKLLGRTIEDEFQSIKQQFGNTPFMGIFSFAEISPLKALDYMGESYIHNESFLALTFAT